MEGIVLEIAKIKYYTQTATLADISRQAYFKVVQFNDAILSHQAILPRHRSEYFRIFRHQFRFLAFGHQGLTLALCQRSDSVNVYIELGTRWIEKSAFLKDCVLLAGVNFRTAIVH